MSTEASGAPATDAPTTTELSPAPGAPETGVVVDTTAQPATPVEGEGQPAQPTPTSPDRSPAGRIAHYSKQAREAELRAAKLEGENEALRRLAQGQPAPVTPTPEVAQPTGPVEPDPNNRELYPLGDIDPQYFKDMVSFEAKKIVAETLDGRDQQAKENEANSTYTTQVETAAAAVAEAGYPEGEQFLRTALEKDNPAVREIVGDLLSTQNSTMVVAYFGKNVEQFKQIATLPVRERLRAIDLIDRELGQRVAARPQPAPASGAPSAQPAPATNTPVTTPTVSGAPMTNGFDPLTATPAEVDARLRVLREQQKTVRA